MKNILVAYKTASLLKEVDFNEITDYYYPVGSIEPIRTLDYWNMYDSTIACPTQSLAQKWLREVKNIFVYVENWYDVEAQTIRNDMFYWVFYTKVVVDVNSDIDNDEWFDDEETKYSTYEEALEVGLQEALKYLKNNKI